MSRWLPHPILSASLLVFWLLLNQSLWLGHILLGTVLAVLGGRAVGLLEPETARVQRPALLIPLLGRVLVDVVNSNIAVSRLILSSSPGNTPGFLRIPLELKNTYALAVLACIITSTPGTAWVNFDRTSGTLLIHVLDLDDEARWTVAIKNRYESLLLEIFA
jgi:multicomponent K+:H+ antiporter subunit E